jgi:hypothetical protein
MSHGTIAGCAAGARSGHGSSPRKGRGTEPVESTENALGVSDVPEYTEDELATIASRYRVALVQAPEWATYDRAMGVWRQRCLSLLPALIASPEAYMARLLALKAKRDGQPASMGWELEQREALEVLRAQLLELAKPDQTPTSFAIELSAEFERRRRHPVVLDLCAGGWLPKPPIRPDCQGRPFDAADEASRQASAEQIAASMFDDHAPEVAHDGRAKAAGDL